MKALQHKNRRGMTLVEVLIASSISVVVLLAVCSGTSACYQFYESMMADTELSLHSRALRDKILFHATAPANGTVSSGFLSGTNLVVNTSSLSMICETVGASGTRGTRQMNLRLSGTGTSKRLTADNNAQSTDRWLSPSATWINSSWDDLVDTTDLNTKHRIYVDIPLTISLRRPFGGRSAITRTERITIPLFGKVQPTNKSED